MVAPITELKYAKILKIAKSIITAMRLSILELIKLYIPNSTINIYLICLDIISKYFFNGVHYFFAEVQVENLMIHYIDQRRV